MCDAVPLARPSGNVFFPLASNAHALVSGGPVNSVRSRLKVSSLLYDQVLIEAGHMSIQAGPDGSFSWRHGQDAVSEPRWQTPHGRKRAQETPFSVSIAEEIEYCVPAPGPYRQMFASRTSICWSPTFEPFRKELPSRCDWIVFGNPAPLRPEFKRLADRWQYVDEQNGALDRIVPEEFVRSRLIDDISTDLGVGASGGWDVSVDRLHGEVINARFAGDAALEIHGIALPILVPRVGDLPWDDIEAIRRLNGLQRLREVLREVEMEAFEVAGTGGDLEQAVRRAYDRKLRAAVDKVEVIRSFVANELVELIVGTGTGYATIGLGLAGPLVGAAAGAALTGGLRVPRILRARRQRGWVGVMGRISEAAPT